MDIVGALLIEGSTGFTLVACFTVCCGAHAVDCLAKIRAQVVFPRLSDRKKIGMRQFPVAMAFFKVVVSARWPTTDSKVEGRYFRADTI